jgi:hypothetical protein
VLRNPKDVLASYFKFARQFAQKDKFLGTFEDLVENFFEGKLFVIIV